MMEEDPGLLGEDVPGRALSFPGSIFYMAVFLVVVQSFPNKDSFQGQEGSRKHRLKL